MLVMPPLSLEELLQSLPRRTEHGAIELIHEVHGKRMQTVGDGEHDVKVLRSWDDLLTAHVNPLLALLVLALRTMTVTAAVVADVHLSTLRAHVNMPAKVSCAAYSHGREGLPDLGNHLETREEVLIMVPDNLPYVILGPAHQKMVSRRQIPLLVSIFATWRYTMVVLTLLWPRRCCTVCISSPASSKCVA